MTSIFRLAGADAIMAANDDFAAEQVKQIISKDDYKVIIVTEKVSSKLRETRDALLKERRAYPIFVVVPDFEEGALGLRAKELQDLVNRSVGVKLKAGA